MTDSKERKNVIAIYSLISARLCIDPLLGSFFPSTLMRLAELFVFIAIFILWAVYLTNYGPFAYNRRTWILFLILSVVSIGIINRGDFSGGIKEIVFAINSDSRALAYLLPFIILPLPNVRYFNSILNIFFYNSLLAIPLWILNVSNLVQDSYFGESIGIYLPFFAAFMLGLIKRFSLWKRIAIFAVYFFYLLLMVLNARRNVVLSLSLHFFTAFCFYFFSNIKNIRRTIFIVACSFLAAIFLLMNFSKLSSGLLSNILDRGLEDTRSQVEVLLLADLADSPASETIFGRGMDGTYFQITQDDDTFETSTDRNIIETGYLNMVLKGGLVYVLTVILITIAAIISGFRCRNKDIFFISVILLLYLIDNYTANPIAIFNVRSIIFWFSVSCCLQYFRIKSLRISKISQKI